MPSYCIREVFPACDWHLSRCSILPIWSELPLSAGRSRSLLIFISGSISQHYCWLLWLYSSYFNCWIPFLPIQWLNMDLSTLCCYVFRSRVWAPPPVGMLCSWSLLVFISGENFLSFNADYLWRLAVFWLLNTPYIWSIVQYGSMLCYLTTLQPNPEKWISFHVYSKAHLVYLFADAP